MQGSKPPSKPPALPPSTPPQGNSGRSMRSYMQIAGAGAAIFVLGIAAGFGIVLQIVRVHNRTSAQLQTNTTADFQSNNTVQFQVNCTCRAPITLFPGATIGPCCSETSARLGSSEFRNLSRLVLGIGLSLVALWPILSFISRCCQRLGRAINFHLHNRNSTGSVAERLASFRVRRHQRLNAEATLEIAQYRADSDRERLLTDDAEDMEETETRF